MSPSPIPDRFDLFVRKARKCVDTSRQIDLIVGALMGLRAWYFLTDPTHPHEPAQAEMEGTRCALVFSDRGRLEEATGPSRAGAASLPMAPPEALACCAASGLALLINAGENAVLIPAEAVQHFASEWREGRGRAAAGYWTAVGKSEEEDFWQEMGL